MNLDDLMRRAQIASPCSADWDSMPGDEKMRLCGQCNKHVLNAIEMTDAEVMAVFDRIAGGQRVCMQLYRREDGTFLTKDCPIGLRKRLAANARQAAAWVAGGLSMFLALAGNAQTAPAKKGDGGACNKPVWHSTIKSSDAAVRARTATAGSTAGNQPQGTLQLLKGEMMATPFSRSPQAVAARRQVQIAEKESGVDSAPCAVEVMKLADVLMSEHGFEEAQETYQRVVQMAQKNKVIAPHARTACLKLAEIMHTYRGNDSARQAWLKRAEEFAPPKATIGGTATTGGTGK